MRPPRHIPSLRPLLASVALLAACTEAPSGAAGTQLALVQAKLPDDPNRLVSIDLPRVPIATGGRGGYGLVRGDVDGEARLIVVDELAPAVAATLRGDELTTIGITDGASDFIVAVDDASVAVTEVAATPTADNQYVQIPFEYYISVNGYELRPEPGAAFGGTFIDYPSNPWRQANCH